MDECYLDLKNGTMVRKARTGKKCMGIANPGNNSGNSISSGSLKENTMMMDAKLRTANTIFSHPRFKEGRHLMMRAYASDIRVHPIRQVMIMLVGEMILLKST
jgi:hypothetical protein